MTEIADETSESPSPSISSPLVRFVSAIRLVDGDEAIAAKPAAVRNVSSLIISNRIKPGLFVVPTMLPSIYELGIPVQASNDASNAALAWATVRNAGPSGLGMGSSV